jgi:hypothetical protein
VVIIDVAHLQGMRHLLNAGVIGSTHKPDEVIEELISSNKSVTETDIPLVRDWPSALSVYDVEMKVSVIFTPNAVYYPTALTKELEDKKSSNYIRLSSRSGSW